jgi:hypothetical protein
MTDYHKNAAVKNGFANTLSNDRFAPAGTIADHGCESSMSVSALSPGIVLGLCCPNVFALAGAHTSLCWNESEH